MAEGSMSAHYRRRCRDLENQCKILRKPLEIYCEEFEKDFLAGGQVVINAPGEKWSPLVPIYEISRAALQETKS